jgi:outer membrane protein assembly factor BamB
VANGVVYATSDDGTFDAFDATTGARLWTDDASLSTDNLSSPAVVNGIIYVGSGDDTVYAFHLPA